jgi:hypothetical protein
MLQSGSKRKGKKKTGSEASHYIPPFASSKTPPDFADTVMCPSIRDLHSMGIWFEFLPGHRLSQLMPFMVLLSSFSQMLRDKLLTNHSIILRGF